ncbi:aquaporin AQPcic isoform X1 [Hydra vulgaris]|uniref:Aquaporin-2 n=1 Tax=Hydra vulgaris TaxID=6087 RepID=T2MGA8_HYDVU|nr:aquaporin AQPcic isoform X1 [Hydra vulgaris]
MLNCCEELYYANFYASLLLEAVATALLVFIGGGTFIRVDIPLLNNGKNDHVVETAAVFGLTLAGLLYCLRNVSGAYVNPAVTCAAILTRKTSILRGFFYVIFQCGGGILGALMLRELIPHSIEKDLSNTILSDGITLGKGIALEAIFTFTYSWIYFSSKSSNVFKGFGGPLAVGFFYGASHIVIMQYTGCSLNPARSFGPAILTNKLDHHWVYWAGPVLSACLAGLMNDIVFKSAKLVEYPRLRSCSLIICKPSREEAMLVEYSRHHNFDPSTTNSEYCA